MNLQRPNFYCHIMKFWVNMDLGGMHYLTHYIHGNNITFFKIKQYYIKCPLKTPTFFSQKYYKFKSFDYFNKTFSLRFCCDCLPCDHCLFIQIIFLIMICLHSHRHIQLVRNKIWKVSVNGLMPAH